MHNIVDGKETLWDTTNLFKCPPCYKHAVVVLDRPIQLPKSVVLPLWEKAAVTVTVDGGTDRWMDYLGDEIANDVYNGKCSSYAPTMISGDMDSVLPDTRGKLKKIGTEVIDTPNQNYTDYTKALVELTRHCKSQDIKLDGIYVLVDTSGRFDHLIGNINTLYKSSHICNGVEVIQVASDSLTWLLRPGQHRITIPEELVRAQCWCGILPFGGKVVGATSTGLRWNLDNLSLEFGGLVSTSNTYENACTEVTLVLQTPSIWTMGIAPLLTHHVNSHETALEVRSMEESIVHTLHRHTIFGLKYTGVPV